MKNFKLVLIWVLLLVMMVGTSSASAQGDVPDEIKTAIRNGSSNDLARYFNNTVEIGLDGEKSSYSKTQAEFVLKNFFSKNAPVGFEFDHQGSSNQGQRYAIGTYNSKAGPYRVFVVVKQANGSYLIDTIDFTKK
ncbi:hypothetical protein AAE02nite_33480 [Adhaeribacter aerolatus]|uniref:DUF4783 domain-containing protein n=1 Tax=Adhaeribacter aerolatus TaxID=670289 RepID=A0A512B133_9BACT|nr:DUF4783 domain-containing protein [Adhaeribacter aerolatus]GEO05684.1 hypothetical protein AAE02nite_33480 [Adhaeribacter aerolatus]